MKAYDISEKPVRNAKHEDILDARERIGSGQANFTNEAFSALGGERASPSIVKHECLEWCTMLHMDLLQ